MILSFSPQKQTNVIGQAADFLRSLIASSALAEGQKLPSTATLAKEWGLPVASVQLAMTELVKDGLLFRQAGKGTFVCRDKAPLTAVALYTLADALANPESSIQRAILAELQRQLNNQGIQAQVVVDPRSGEELIEPHAALQKLAREHRVGASIALVTDRHMLDWFGRLPHAVVLGEHGQRAGQVRTHFNQLADLCLGALAEKGCRSVGLICALRPDVTPMPDVSRHPYAVFYEHLVAVAGGHGLRISDHWMRLSPPTLVAGVFARAGYDLFHALWAEPEHPDGLMVYPDSFMPGVLLAMAELGVRPPALQLAYHRNEQTPLLNPYPATEAILSERQMAAALIAQAQKLWRGESCEPLLVGFRREDVPKLEKNSGGQP